MSKYIVKPEDLVEKIEDFPIEVVQKMVDYQENPNVNVFKRDPCASIRTGGFNWNYTEEGDDFWNDVIVDKNFNLFFTKFPIESYCELEYHPEIYDRLIKNIIKLKGLSNPSDIFHDYIEKQSIAELFNWSCSSEGFDYWNNVVNGIFRENTNYKITYYVKSKLQRKETGRRVQDDSRRSGSESRNTEARPSILYYGDQTVTVGEATLVKGFENAVSSARPIDY